MHIWKKKKYWLISIIQIKGPFELLHADIADKRFLAKSAVVPKYCLLFIYLFTSKIYTYTTKKELFKKKK